jgi:hypothetical protein
MTSFLLKWVPLPRLLNKVKKAHKNPHTNKIARSNLAAITLLSWFSMLGFDFLLHAGLLSWIYLKPSPFLLPPERMFRLIPLGYLSFLLMAMLLCWLMVTRDIVGIMKGSVFGLKLGGLIWGSLTLGLASISTAEFSLLCGWFIGQTIEFGIAGSVIGSALEGRNLRRLFVMVLAFIIFSFIITVILQTVGFAPVA